MPFIKGDDQNNLFFFARFHGFAIKSNGLSLEMLRWFISSITVTLTMSPGFMPLNFTLSFGKTKAKISINLCESIGFDRI